MKFTKMHGTGNDYVYINLVSGYDDSVQAEYIDNKLIKVAGKPVADVAIEVSDRHFGIGSDGLIAIAPSDVADVRMIMFNADGSEGAMCGNGIRCVAKYSYDHGLLGDIPNTTTAGDEKYIETDVETASGIKHLKLTIKDGKCTYVEVNMGQAILNPSDIPVDIDKLIPENSDNNSNSNLNNSTEKIINQKLSVNNKIVNITCVSMGNPHCVIFTEKIDELDLESIGPHYENHPAFPDRINTEFVEVIDDHTVKMRVWERGSGETISCGTGTCAVTVAAVLNGYVKQGTEVEVQIRGGKLYDTYLPSGEVLMKGPATEVYSGEINI